MASEIGIEFLLSMKAVIRRLIKNDLFLKFEIDR